MTTEQTLPKGWEQTTLGEVAQVLSGGTPSTKLETNFVEKGKGIGWITPADLSKYTDKFISNGARDLSIDGYESCSAKLLPAGTILLSSRAPIGYVAIAQSELSTNQGFKNFILSDDILSEYVYYYLKSIKSTIESLGSGTTFLELSATNAKKIPIIYPTNKEAQQTIVNKIESLFAEIDEGIGRLKTAVQQLTQYRQSLLKNAFDGELTKAWREENADALPTADELLAQIQTTREQHHAQQLADWQTAVEQWEQNGKEGKKPGKPKAPTQAVKFEGDFADLPNGWGMVKLENIADIGSGMSVSASRKLANPITVNYLRVGNVQRGYLDLKEIKEMQIEAENFDKYSLGLGDVLFNEGGDRDKLGRGWIWENQIQNCITQNHVFRASPFLKSITHSKYISYLGNSRYGQSYFEKTGKQTTNLASINKTVLSNFPVKFPSLAEQTQIVAVLENKLTACDRLAAELAAQLKQAELLKQSVLKAAFSGRLSDDLSGASRRLG